MARPRFSRFRRPPPPEPPGYERVVEERVAARPRTPFETLWFWLALAGIVILAVVLIVLATDDDADRRSRPRTVTVPAVVGSDHVQAATRLERLGLPVTTAPVDGPDPAGRVLEQEPVAGTRVRRGTGATLSVSIGTTSLAPIPVPDATGPNAAAARDLLRRAGFTVRTVPRDAPSREEVGEVLDQDPAAGTFVRGLSQVTIFVGR